MITGLLTRITTVRRLTHITVAMAPTDILTMIMLRAILGGAGAADFTGRFILGGVMVAATGMAITDMDMAVGIMVIMALSGTRGLAGEGSEGGVASRVVSGVGLVAFMAGASGVSVAAASAGSMAAADLVEGTAVADLAEAMAVADLAEATAVEAGTANSVG
ncbi:membrane hypothetical protein [Verrucomicrobia bacterium]|nr:membrane hypothetical protein [Verrucomicrobiota bacterium]